MLGPRPVMRPLPRLKSTGQRSFGHGVTSFPRLRKMKGSPVPRLPEGGCGVVHVTLTDGQALHVHVHVPCGCITKS